MLVAEYGCLGEKLEPITDDGEIITQQDEY